MRILVIIALLAQVLTQDQDYDCEKLPGTDSEFDYRCPVANGSVTFKFQRNDYVNVVCEGQHIDYCANPFMFEFASGRPLPSLGLNYCPPSLLRCINDVVDASSVTKVTLVGMTEPLVEEDVVNLGEVHAFTLRRAGIQTTVPISVIRSLPSLTEVRLGEARLALQPHIFDTAPNLTYLEFGQSHLASVPKDSFNGLASLLHLNIWGNNISEFGVGALRGLDNLNQLSLGTNKLKTIAPGTFKDVPKLKVLHVMAESVALVPNGLLQDLTQIQNLTWKMNSVPLAFGEKALSGLPNLKNVRLTLNGIKNIPETLFQDSKGIELIDLTSNQIGILPENIFNTTISLKILILNKNKVKELHENIFMTLRNLEYLYMNDNQLESLPQDLFPALKNLKEVHFDRNKIATISSTTFLGPVNLQTVSLGNNKLTFNKYGTFTRDLTSPFQYLENIRRLNLTGNQISVIHEDWRLILNKLEELNLSYNAFTHLMFDDVAGTSYFLSSKVTIDLRYNEIQQISLNHRINTRDPLPLNQTATILLENNNFKCDCVMYYVKLRLNGNVAVKDEPNLVFDNATCAYPPNLKGFRIIDVSPNSLICNLTDTEQNYKLYARPATNELLIESSYLPKELPDTNMTQLEDTFNKIPTINIKLKHQPISLKHLNIHTLDLSNSNMTSIDFLPSNSLKVLNVSNNFIKSIPNEFLERNISIYIKNNLLDCSCANQNNIAIISASNYVHDAMCSDKRFVNSQLDINGLCHAQNAALIGISTFIIIAVFVIIIGSLIYVYFNEILIWLIKHKWLKEKMNGKEYDVFISFCHTERDIVSKILLPKLEKELRQKVCVHDRDWLVGEMIPIQIKNSVEKSRKTIILLSKDFLDSDWANQEFYTAHNLSLKDNSPRVILILLDEGLTKHPKLSTELKAYISTNTYLLWDDPNFTKRLNEAITEMSTYVINFPKSQKDIDNKSKEKGLDVRLINGNLVNMNSPAV